MCCSLCFGWMSNLRRFRMFFIVCCLVSLLLSVSVLCRGLSNCLMSVGVLFLSSWSWLFWCGLLIVWCLIFWMLCWSCVKWVMLCVSCRLVEEMLVLKSIVWWWVGVVRFLRWCLKRLRCFLMMWVVLLFVVCCFGCVWVLRVL